MTHILLTRTDRIGDLVLSTAAIATVRRSFPQARMTMVCSAYNRVVMERNTDVDEVVEPGGASGRAFGQIYRGVDLAIALSPRLADLEIAGATRAPIRAGYTYARRYLLRLTARRFVNRLMISEADPALSEWNPRRRVRHEVDQLLDLVALAGASRRVESLRLDLTDGDRESVAYLPAGPIVLHLGLRWFRDGSSLESTIALLREMQRFGLPLVVTYAPECEQYVERISSERCADVVLGGLPFHRWAAVLERARVVVTVDTGATHVASAVGRPVVVVFEHRFFHLNKQEWAPYRVPSVLVRKPASESGDALRLLRADIVQGVARLVHG